MRIQSTTAESWKPAVQLALAFAAIKFAIEFIGNLLAQHFGYGIFRDEMYYIVCGRHLAWGYVDQAPMVALQARIAEMLFGFRHLALFRSFSALAGAVKVFLTGILAWQLGGRRIAQVMAMIAVLIAPVYLGIDSFLSMNSFEPVFWMGCMVVVLLMVAGNSPKWWIMFGVLGGMGLLNKPSMAFFLVALLIGLLLTPQRRILWSRWTLAAVALIVVIALPYLLWQIHHQWPTLVWLNNVNHSHKNVKLGPLAFVGAQIMMLNPISIFLLLPGLVWLLVANVRTRVPLDWPDVCRAARDHDPSVCQGLLRGTGVSSVIRCGCTGVAESLFRFAKNGVAAAGLVYGDGHPRSDHASHGNSCHAAVYLDSLYQSASPDQPEY